MPRLGEGLDSSFGISGRAAYRLQPTPGFTSPWIELAGQLDGFKYRDSDIRDRYAGSVAASVGKYDGDVFRIGYLLRFR